MTEITYEKLDLLTFKNLILVPFFEEFIFRACIINLFIESDIMSYTNCVLITPIFFAVAHIHHCYR